MAVKSDRLEARISPEERAQLELAAAITGTSVSTFVVGAAIERADEVVAEQTSTAVPPEYFDRLVAALDKPDQAPTLARAARRVDRRPRIAAR